MRGGDLALVSEFSLQNHCVDPDSLYQWVLDLQRSESIEVPRVLRVDGFHIVLHGRHGEDAVEDVRPDESQLLGLVEDGVGRRGLLQDLADMGVVPEARADLGGSRRVQGSLDPPGVGHHGVELVEDMVGRHGFELSFDRLA